MENLNAEQVKKDLRNIVDNYSGSWTRFNILSNALALINSQEQRIKELTEGNERLRAETLENIKIQFAMRYGTYTDKDMTPITEVFRILDKIAKEMLEGEK